MLNGKQNTHNAAHTREATLNLLDVVGNGEPLTQRSLALELGVALGLTNSLIKRCIRKGLLKVQQAPTHRYAYYLTPKGFREKSHLTAEYLSVSMNFFRKARIEYSDAAIYCKARGWSRIALYGATELAEIAVLSGIENAVEYAVIIDTTKNTSHYCGLAVTNDIHADKAQNLDAIVVTDMSNPQGTFEQLSRMFPATRIVTPPLLRITRTSEGKSFAKKDLP